MKKQIKKEIERCKELLKLYEEIPTGGFAAIMINRAIRKGKLALESGADVSMKAALKELKEIEG